MEAWKSLVSHVTARFPYATRDGSNALRFVVVLAGTHRVAVRLRCVPAYHAHAIVMTAELGTHDAIDAYAGLVTNLRLVTGALACDGNVLVLRVLVADATSFDAQLELFAREAATLKQTLTRPLVTHAASTMAHYAD
ncbi:MAG: hypothetical protein ACKV2T_39055 [Kofleriaceae bacterium]